MTRPQLGIAPKRAVFTRFEVATVCAICFAVLFVAAPVTSTRTTFGDTLAIPADFNAKVRHTSSSIAQKRAKSADPGLRSDCLPFRLQGRAPYRWCSCRRRP